jgi:hypothetical protein
MKCHLLRAPRRRWLALVGLCASVLTVAMSASAQAVVRPTVTVTNDANHDGVFTSSETVPKNAQFPYSVDYRVTIDTTGTPIGAFVASLTDDTTANIGTCAALVGTAIPTNSSATCNYTVSFTAPAASPVVNTVTLTYNAGGLDIVSGSSTVTFEQQQTKSKCNSGNGNGSDVVTFIPGEHCYGGDPGNSFNAGNKGGDEIPTTVPQGGVPNPGGNNVP